MSAPAPARRSSRAASGPIVGRDFAREQHGGRSLLRGATPYLLGAAVLVGLAVAALRNDLIHMRYGLTAAMKQERELLEERRELTARVRALRDPARLSRLAEERGFIRPERVLKIEPAGGEPR
jgi:hypothetical protein